MIVINKCDAENINLPELIEGLGDIRHGCVLMTIPLATGSQFTAS